MGMKDMPCKKMYWSQGVWEEPFVCVHMSRTRFRLIKRCQSAALRSQEANMTDKLAKTILRIDMFTAITRKYYCDIPVQNLALDEFQILCCARKTWVGHHGDKHNIKPLKDYVKSFGFHESGTGYCLSIAIDDRSSLTTKDYGSRLLIRRLSLPSFRCADLCLSILNMFFSGSYECTFILIWYLCELFVLHFFTLYAHFATAHCTELP